MNTQDIEQLILLGESDKLEFKTSTAQLKPAFKTACAFLNGKGGIVLIGVNQDGKSVGQSITDKTRKEIATELSKIEPNLPIAVHYVELEQQDKWIIALYSPKTDYAPYLYDGRAYQRHQSSTVRMLQQHYEHLLMNRAPVRYSWESILVPGYPNHGLDEDEIRRTVLAGIQANRIPAIANQEDTQTLLQRLGLLSEDVYNRAAIVLYARKEHLTLLQCTLKMARFIGKDKLGDYIDNQQVSGHAFSLLSEADAFLRKHLSIASFFKADQWKRIDQPTLPVLAVREALINAICHRDYADESTNVTLAIFDDRIEIWNSGRLPPNLTIADLKKHHDSFPRNKLIAHVLYACGLIEGWGTGTNKMIELCKASDVPTPLFKERSGGLLITFRFKQPLGNAYAIPSKNVALTNRQREILKIIQHHKSANVYFIQSALAHPISQRVIQLDLKVLKQAGFIQLRGRAQLATWVLVQNMRDVDESF